jgi:hypothetical protein
MKAARTLLTAALLWPLFDLAWCTVVGEPMNWSRSFNTFSTLLGAAALVWWTRDHQKDQPE